MIHKWYWNTNTRDKNDYCITTAHNTKFENTVFWKYGVVAVHICRRNEERNRLRNTSGAHRERSSVRNISSILCSPMRHFRSISDLIRTILNWHLRKFSITFVNERNRKRRSKNFVLLEISSYLFYLVKITLHLRLCTKARYIDVETGVSVTSYPIHGPGNFPLV